MLNWEKINIQGLIASSAPAECPNVDILVWLASVLLQFLVQLLSFAMSNLHRANRVLIRLLQFHWPVSDIFTYIAMSLRSR